MFQDTANALLQRMRELEFTVDLGFIDWFTEMCRQPYQVIMRIVRVQSYGDNCPTRLLANRDNPSETSHSQAMKFWQAITPRERYLFMMV